MQFLMLKLLFCPSQLQQQLIKVHLYKKLLLFALYLDYLDILYREKLKYGKKNEILRLFIQFTLNFFMMSELYHREDSEEKDPSILTLDDDFLKSTATSNISPFITEINFPCGLLT